MATSKPETKPPARKATAKAAAAVKSSPSKTTTKAPTKALVETTTPTKKTAALAKPALAATRSVAAPAAKTAPARKPAAAAKKAAAPAKKQPAAVPAAPAARPALLSGDNPQIAKADGDAPVQAYIAAIPNDWRRSLCARLDALVKANVPEVSKAVRWNSPFYGIAGQGWFLGYHVFAKFIKVSFFKGALLTPAPEGGSGEDARWINIQEGGLDEAQMVAWIRQAAALPGWGKN